MRSIAVLLLLLLMLMLMLLRFGGIVVRRAILLAVI